MSRFVLGLAALVVACGAPHAEPDHAAPLDGPAACEPIRRDFRAALAAASGACDTDAACGCYDPVVGEAACGGITDAPTAAVLAGIEARFHAAECPWPHQCPAWTCQPSCVDGRCQ